MSHRIMCFSIGLLTGAAVFKMVDSAMQNAQSSSLEKTAQKLKKTVMTATDSVVGKAETLFREKTNDLVDFLDGLDWGKLKGFSAETLSMLKDKLASVKESF